MGLASIYMTAQIGVETVAGTLAAANKRLTSVGFSMSPNPDISVFRASGSKYPSVAALNREWTELDIEGAITYTEIVYLLSGILEKAAITGTTEKTWTFTPATSAADDIQTYTIEQGSAARAHRVSYALISDLTLSFGREESTIGGTAIATAMEDGITMTAAPTEIALVPVTGPQISVYAEDTRGGADGCNQVGWGD